MINKVTMYRVVCDRCGKSAQDDSDYYAWSEPDQAVDCARDADWLLTEDDKHHCLDCWEWSADESEMVPKPAVVETLEKEGKQ